MEPRKKPFEQIRYVAGSVANEIFKVYKKTKHRKSITLAMAQRELTLDIRKPTAKQLARAKRFLAEPDESNLPRRAKAYAKFAVQLAQMHPTEDIILQALRIGDVGIVSIPCEVFVEIGLRFKAESPFAQTFTIELANGYNGYLPTAEQHALGGYETWRARSSYLEVDAARKISASVFRLLGTLAESGDD